MATKASGAKKVDAQKNEAQREPRVTGVTECSEVAG